jgi:hypothetical protein
MFRINKPLLIPQKYASDMVEYSMPCHGIFCHVENEYTKNIPLHGMKYFQRFIRAHVNMLTSSSISIIETNGVHSETRFMELWTLKRPH